MGRPPRLDYAGAFHHVMNRGTARTMLFRSDDDRRRFLAFLSELDVRFGVRVLAFVLMGNHYHLVVRSLEGRLPEAMHFLDGRYARRFNAVHERQGALFQGRYASVLIEDSSQLEMAGIYVHLNPVRAGLAEVSTSYRWSSLRSYALGKSPMPWLHLDLLGARTGEEYVRDTLRWSDELAEIDLAIDDDGSSWWAPTDIEVVDECPGDGIDEATVTASDDVVADVFGVSVDELYIVAPGRQNVPRMVAIARAAEFTAGSRRAVAVRYGLRSDSAVRKTIASVRRLASADASLADRLRTIGVPC